MVLGLFSTCILSVSCENRRDPFANFDCCSGVWIAWTRPSCFFEDERFFFNLLLSFDLSLLSVKSW